MAHFVSKFAEPADPEYASPVVKGETPLNIIDLKWIRSTVKREFITTFPTAERNALLLSWAEQQEAITDKGVKKSRNKVESVS
ncbi:hypothetical protein Tco_1287302, partial [Tanacetum coccineum]